MFILTISVEEDAGGISDTYHFHANSSRALWKKYVVYFYSILTSYTHILQTAVVTEPPKLPIMCVTPGVRREIIVVLKLYGRCQE